MTLSAQLLLFNSWLQELKFLKQFKKCAGYGDKETPATLWAKLPPVSKTYWENKFYQFLLDNKQKV